MTILEQNYIFELWDQRHVGQRQREKRYLAQSTLVAAPK